ncbi:MAG TPA: nucleoside monophosphate kinase [Verrucomicrobiae bacterium]|nr:nucleoside monophosphate kinase [Verrucomicrobiae bacterium]
MHHSLNANQISKIKSWLGTSSLNIFGRPFAGKDTQGKILSDMFDGQLLGGGDILRNSTIPERSQQALKQGLLIPTDEYLEIVLPYFSQDAFKDKPFILSSVGRWHGEEPGVLEATERSGHPIKVVLYLDIPEEAARVRRHKSREERSRGDRGSRHDDAPEIFETRLKEFRQKTLPVIEYYQATPLFAHIDANRPGVEVTAQILEELLARAEHKKPE